MQEEFYQKLNPKYEHSERMAISRMLSSMFLPTENCFVFKNAKGITEKVECNTFLDRLNRMEPLDYILGFTHFFDLKIEVNSQVLIPRSETEELVWYLKNELQRWEKKDLKILEIGTGSGAIALALKRFLPHLSITAVEISDKALQLAKANAKNLNLDIRFLQLDFLDQKAWKKIQHHVDVIVSNPPYIDRSEEVFMDTSVLRYEPDIALFALGDPLIFYRSILRFAKTVHTKPLIYLECNALRAHEVKALYKNHYKYVTVIDDMQNKPRILRAADTQFEKTL